MDDGIERIEIPAAGFIFDAVAAGPADGEPVLLLHGFPQSSHEWRAQLGALAGAGYRAVAPDQRGYSPRARPVGVEHYRAEHLVGDVVAMADALGFGRFHLVGHDWGAAVAWHVAGRHQSRLRTLTPVSVPHPVAFADALRGDDQRQRSSYIDLFRQEGKAEELMLEDGGQRLRAMLLGTGLVDRATDADIDEYVTRMVEPGALTAALNWYRAVDIGSIEGLGPITMPTMFVWSTDDLALGREGAEATAQHVEGPYRFEVLEGVSHWIPEAAADDLNRLLLDHLAQAV
jgi:pimeloyl-ACP methyl ester carboxylesterase